MQQSKILKLFKIVGLIMYKNKRVLGLICARGGSQGLAHKNILPFNGIPMIAGAIQKLHEILEVDRIVVSSDSPEILEISKAYGADIPFVRPKNLAESHTAMIAVVQHCLQALAPDIFDILILLQANSPLSKVEDIQKGLYKLVDKELNVVFSVTPCRHPPQWTLALENDEINYAFPQDVNTLPTCRQAVPSLYRTTGAFSCSQVVYVQQNDTALLCLPQQGQKSGCIVTSYHSAIDIDFLEDYELAKIFLHREK